MACTLVSFDYSTVVSCFRVVATRGTFVTTLRAPSTWGVMPRLLPVCSDAEQQLWEH